MPSASSYTNKLRALTDARNTKVQYPGDTVNTYRPGLALTCDANLVPSVVTIAGVQNNAGYTGDNGPATKATLNEPYSICTDSIGNIYISDRGARCVRKIDVSGKISRLISFTGTEPSPLGLTIDDQDILYIADPNNGEDSNGRIVRFNTKTNVTTYILSNNTSLLFRPFATWISKNQLYIANARGGSDPYYYGTISVYSFDTSAFTNTYVSDNYTNFSFPRSIAVGPDGSIYIVERNTDVLSQQFRHCVRKLKDTIYTTIYTTFAGSPNTPSSSDEIGDGGPATSATLNNPSSVFVDTFGNVYICDTGNSRIRMVSPDGIIQTVVGGGAAYNEGGGPLNVLTVPVGMWFDAKGRMYFTDATQHVVRRINSVYKPSWWDMIQYQKICKPCNAFVPTPPLPPVPTILNLQLLDSSAGQGILVNLDESVTGTAIPVTPSNNLVHLIIRQLNSAHSYDTTKYIAIRLPNFNGEFVAPVSAYLNGESLLIEYIYSDTEAYINVNGELISTTPIIVTFEGPINSITRVYSEEFPPPLEP